MRDLYRIPGLPEDLAQEFERTFMQLVDTEANYALEKIESGDRTPWTSSERSAWVRFILSLRLRNPEVVQTLRDQMLQVWQAALDNLRENYGRLRQPDDPPTFEQYLACTEPGAPHKAALILLQEVIDSRRVGPAIFDMKWSRVPLFGSRISLLTSDRPLDMRLALDSDNAYIALPVNPKVLFIASRDPDLGQRLAGADPTTVVKRINEVVVEQARKFVWGVDASQLRFVQNRMSRQPDRPVLTDEQRASAIDATRNLTLR